MGIIKPGGGSGADGTGEQGAGRKGAKSTSYEDERKSAVDRGLTRENYGAIFNVEIEGWCHGIASYPGEIDQAHVFSVLKTLARSFRLALALGVQFDILELAAKFSKAAKYLVGELDIISRILVTFPNPATVTEAERAAIEAVLNQVESRYSGTKEIIEKNWAQA